MSAATPRISLPRAVDARKLASQGECFRLELPLAELQRVVEATASPEGLIAVDLHFARNEENKPVVTGSLQGEVQVICQRCLEPMAQTVKTEVKVMLVWSDEQAENLPSSYEPWIVGDEPVDIRTLVEDELLLALPIVAYHDHDCSQWQADEPEQTDQPEERDNPFKVLEQLKKH